jgi:hypothetical protein
VIDYALLYPLDYHLISPKPKPVDPYLNLLKPFSDLAWVAIIIAFVVTALAYKAGWLDHCDIWEGGLTVYGGTKGRGWGITLFSAKG